MDKILFTIVLFVVFRLIRSLYREGFYLITVWLIYILIEVVFGFISKELFSDEARFETSFSMDFLLVFFISTISIYFGFKIFINRRKLMESSTVFKTLNNRVNKVLLLMLVPFLFVTFRLMNLKSDGILKDNRALIVEDFSGLEFLMLKFGFVILALIAYKKSKWNVLNIILVLFVLFSFSLYGGRFLIFSGIIIFFLIYYHNINNFKRLLRWQFLFPLFVGYLIVSIFISNTRYYMSYNYSFQETLNSEFYAHTAFRQLGGNWLEFSRVSDIKDEIPLSQFFFPTLLEGFLPESIRNQFFFDFFKNRISYGKYFAQKVAEDDNALRMNFTNEIFFSFGYFGVVIYSMLIGTLFFYFERIIWTARYPVAIFFFIQLMSAHILGINTISSSVLLILTMALIFKYGNLYRSIKSN
jgi:hypothetical protein